VPDEKAWQLPGLARRCCLEQLFCERRFIITRQRVKQSKPGTKFVAKSGSGGISAAEIYPALLFPEYFGITKIVGTQQAPFKFGKLIDKFAALCTLRSLGPRRLHLGIQHYSKFFYTRAAPTHLGTI